MNNPDNNQLPKIFIVCWNDIVRGMCIPMMWDEKCKGALCSITKNTDKITIFTSKADARKTIDISSKWNALLKAQGKTYTKDFQKEYRKNISIMECNA